MLKTEESMSNTSEVKDIGEKILYMDEFFGAGTELDETYSLEIITTFGVMKKLDVSLENFNLPITKDNPESISGSLSFTVGGGGIQ